MIDQETAIKFDNAMLEVHSLLAEAMIRDNHLPRIEKAEQIMHDLRNEWAALTGLGLRFASVPACE